MSNGAGRETAVLDRSGSKTNQPIPILHTDWRIEQILPQSRPTPQAERSKARMPILSNCWHPGNAYNWTARRCTCLSGCGYPYPSLQAAGTRCHVLDRSALCLSTLFIEELCH
jgi:hypothetical protein